MEMMKKPTYKDIAMAALKQFAREAEYNLDAEYQNLEPLIRFFHRRWFPSNGQLAEEEVPAFSVPSAGKQAIEGSDKKVRICTYRLQGMAVNSNVGFVMPEDKIDEGFPKHLAYEIEVVTTCSALHIGTHIQNHVAHFADHKLIAGSSLQGVGGFSPQEPQLLTLDLLLDLVDKIKEAGGNPTVFLGYDEYKQHGEALKENGCNVQLMRWPIRWNLRDGQWVKKEVERDSSTVRDYNLAQFEDAYILDPRAFVILPHRPAPESPSQPPQDCSTFHGSIKVIEQERGVYLRFITGMAIKPALTDLACVIRYARLCPKHGA